MKKGYYVFMYGKDCFIETDARKRIKTLAADFINKVQNKLNRFYNVSEQDIEYVRQNMEFATFELKSCKFGKYIDIKGDDFMFGCDPCNNPFDECILV